MSHTTLDEHYRLNDSQRLPDGTYRKIDWGVYKPVNHPYGYYVAYTNHNLPKSAYTTDDPTRFGELVLNVHTDDGYIGVWTDDDGLTWVEQSFWIEQQFPAEALGRAWGQIAIWDCANDQAITL